VAKCLHCGAPHPVASVGLSHLRNYQNDHQELLCLLCGKTSSTVWEDQYAARHSVEHWLHVDVHREAFEKYPPLSTTTTTTTTISNASNHPNKYFYYHKTPPPPPPLSNQRYHGCWYHQCEYVIPLSSPSSARQDGSITAALPAMACPPLWIIVLDGTCPHRRYWQRVVHLLRRVLFSQPQQQDDSNNNDNNDDDVGDNPLSTTTTPPPPCLHVAILSVQADHTCAIWDLSSPVPHVLQQPLWTTLEAASGREAAASTTTSPATTAVATTTLLQRLVPVDDLHIPHIATALRAMADMGPILAAQSPLAAAAAAGNDGGQQYSLAETLSAILAWLEPCQLAGMITYQDPTTNTPMTPMYAGGKILCLLTNPPDEVGDHRDTMQPSFATQDRVIGRGGWGGSCASTTPGERWGVAHDLKNPSSASIVNHKTTSVMDTNGPTNEVVDPESGTSHENQQDTTTDRFNHFEDEDYDNMTLTALTRQYPHCQPNLVTMYTELGQQCAQAGLGIDILFLLEQQLTITTTTSIQKMLGLPFLKVLSETSGAPGPLLFVWDSDENDDGDGNEQVDARLEREVLARAPWGDRVVLGAELRVRLTPGWSVDVHSSTTEAGSAGILDQPDLNLATRYARAGLMGPASSAEPSESTNLWRMGSCDSFTSMTIDLIMSNQKQFSHWMIEGFGEVKVHPVMQTCFAYNTVYKDDNGHFITERRLRIACRAMPLANTAETLYSSLDCDALAIVLFHKLALSSFQDGLSETLEIGHNWLKSLLLCAYRSAEAQEARQGVDPDDDDDDDDEDDVPTTKTTASAKPLFLPNERLLDREGDLSAADVLVAQGHERLRHIPHILYSLLQCDAFRPSSGAFRPTLDSRCAASAQLSSMTPAALARCIRPRLDLWSSRDEQIIVDQLDLQWKTIVSIVDELESTQNDDHLLLLLDCPYKAAVFDTKCLANGNHAGAGKPGVMDELHQQMEESVRKYRVAPLIEFELPSSSADLALQLRDVLVEDASLASGLKNFEDWKAEIAAMVHE
jgi:hypothetical protein